MSYKRIILGVLAVVLCAGAGVCFGMTITVNWDGSGDYTTIQAAIDASGGDFREIEVAAGTYNEAIDFLGKALRLYSIDGPEVTIIDANGLSASAVSCISGEGLNTVLEGFTITSSYVHYGGGMCNRYSSPTVNNCTFSSNAASYGGGMFNRESNPTVINCTFSNNFASEGGGGMFNGDSNPTVTNCTFSGNTGTFGGGIFNLNGSSPTVTNCTFSGNSAEIGGGMLNDDYSSPMVTGCIFSGNTAIYDGGGMFNWEVSSPMVTNCTFSGNSAVNGGGMHNYDSSPMLTNCILWGDTPDEIYNYDVDSIPIVTYSDVEGGYPGTGNIDSDPLFMDAADGDLHLLSESPCIDAGDSTPLLDASIFQDMDDMIRFVDIVAVPNTGIGFFEFVDMGAYEFNCDTSFAGDVNCDGVVDIKDFAILAGNWLKGV
jgi:hypothetical protein